MRIRLTFWLLLLLAGTILKAQVQIQGTIPATGLVQRNQLWSIVVVNGGAQELTGVVELKLRDRLTGLEMMTAVSTSFLLKKGANALNINTLSPIQYSYTGLQPDNSLGGLLPVGSYIACYSFIYQHGESRDQASQDCIPFDVEALSPPMLIYPADSSVHTVAPSQFTWVPPAPLVLFQSLRYEYIVVEVKPGQLAAEAIQENMPLYNTGSLRQNVLNYSSAAPALEKEKWYAWQVVARDGEHYAGKSETWVFSVKPDNIPEKQEAGTAYTVLSDDPQRAGYMKLNENRIYVRHHSYKATYSGRITISSTTGEMVQQERRDIQYGDNYLQVELKKGLKKDQTYILSLADDNGKQYKVLFSINDQNKK
jgi:hypothetical protein